MSKALLVVVTLFLSACTDSTQAKFMAFGDAGHIKCYSGGVVIYEGKSTGRISGEEQSDGWYFKDAATNKLVRVSGDCVIIN